MELTFDDFRRMADNKNLSKWEKVGFPDSYRAEKEELIFEDIKEKLLLDANQSILDIGCGCSDLVLNIIEFSVKHQCNLFLVDSQEMLANIPSSVFKAENIFAAPGQFPGVDLGMNRFDCILVYSVIQYVFVNQNLYEFIHRCVDLLKPGGRLLLGDIPNNSCRKRFLATTEGQKFISTLPSPEQNKLVFNHSDQERFDDAIIFSILQRYRNFGCETYVLPQKPGLPFSNRREDILIIKR